MREILFRGKRVDNGEWANGNYVEKIHYYDGSELPCIQVVMQKPSVADRFVPCFETELVEVIPETVGQFTGLTDKNRQKIFEGDILRDGKGCDGVVTYIESVACFMAVCDMNDAWGLNEGDPKRPPQLQYTEIIGNIHDNPELLK